MTYALGKAPTAKKFSPTSIGTNEVFARLSELLPTFTQEIAGFCTKHADRRNSELHTGELAFVALGTSQWLPRFYAACGVLLQSMGRNLSDIFSDPEGAQVMVDALGDAVAKVVNQDIKAHQQVWANKTEEDKKTARAQAVLWATRQAGHRVECPACYSQALVQGKPAGAVTTNVQT